MYARGLLVAWSRSSLPFAACKPSIAAMPKRLGAQSGKYQDVLGGERISPSSKRFKSTVCHSSDKEKVRVTDCNTECIQINVPRSRMPGSVDHTCICSLIPFMVFLSTRNTCSHHTMTPYGDTHG